MRTGSRVLIDCDVPHVRAAIIIHRDKFNRHE
jgi:hypothetical protein